MADILATPPQLSGPPKSRRKMYAEPESEGGCAASAGVVVITPPRCAEGTMKAARRSSGELWSHDCGVAAGGTRQFEFVDGRTLGVQPVAP